MTGKARYIYGKNSVKALLETTPDKVFKIFLAEGLKPDKRLQAIQEMAWERRIPVQITPRPKLDQMLRVREESRPSAGSDAPSEESGQPASHQGVVASVAPRTLLDLSALIGLCEEKRRATGLDPRVLLLDGVTDPRNFGAILRVADAAGLDGVIIPRHHSAGFSPAVSKTASGAEETVNVATVGNVTQAIQRLKEAGFWIIGSANVETATPYYQQDYKMPLALVVGSEDEGLSRLVQKNCDLLVKIPMRGTVDSLNVAAATAVLLFEIVRERGG